MKDNEVRIEGKVTRDPKYGQGKNGAYCFLGVATGSGKYAAYHSVAGFKAKAEELKLLRTGDSVEIFGSLGYKKKEFGDKFAYEATITADRVIPGTPAPVEREITDDDIPF